ncbi:MAG TPA: MerR family transcriptional regulator [Mycobacteriales bacterium]|jgi:DNA-binding transcriptional MerR regulator|nr:MerR family transcriptional regulator [Mycobacteriales bacterium]
MGSTLPIGDFARATHLSVKTLRHYHQVGLLEPVDVDPVTGYRRYATGQIPTAQVIRRFRALEMPLNEIHAVLTAADLPARNALIAAHLARMEAGLVRTQGAVASLRDLLERPDAVASIQRRRVEAVAAAAISEVIDIADALLWYQGALGELQATLTAQSVRPSGPSGGVFSGKLFADERGQVTIFIPCEGRLRPMGRVAPLVVPAVELATILHTGPHTDIDRAYGALATYVNDHALAVDGPIREYYLVGPTDTSEESAWRTEIAWPIG